MPFLPLLLSPASFPCPRVLSHQQHRRGCWVTQGMVGYTQMMGREWRVTQGTADYTTAGRVHWACWFTQRTASCTQRGGLHALWRVTHSRAAYTQHSAFRAERQVTSPEHLFYEALFPSHCCPAPVRALQGLGTRSPATTTALPPRRSSAWPARARLCPAGGSPRLTEASQRPRCLPPPGAGDLSLSHLRAFLAKFFLLAWSSSPATTCISLQGLHGEAGREETLPVGSPFLLRYWAGRKGSLSLQCTRFKS